MNNTNVTLEESLRIFNYFYKLGAPLISDRKYNELFSQLRIENPNSDLITKTWSETPRPTELLRRTGFLAKVEEIERKLQDTTNSTFFLPEANMKLRDQYLRECIEHFESYIPKSIDSIENIPASDNWLATVKGNKPTVMLHFSIKADGFNIMLYYVYGHFIYARTRGRSGDADDVTIAMSKVVKLKIPTEEKFLRITSEAVMDKDSLEELRRLDPTRDWKSSRSSVRTLLMNSIGEDFNRRIVPLAFKVQGLEFPSKTEEYDWLESAGFRVPYNDTREITDNIELLDAVREFSEYNSYYGNDGCVVTIDDTDLYHQFDTSGKYDFGQRAYRMFKWQSNLYISIVKDFPFDYNSKQLSLKISIIPTKVTNGSVQTTMDVDNLSRIEAANLQVGSFAVFWMKSDSCPEWLQYETLALNNAIRDKKPIPAALAHPLLKLQKALSERREVI